PAATSSGPPTAAPSRPSTSRATPPAWTSTGTATDRPLNAQKEQQMTPSSRPLALCALASLLFACSSSAPSGAKGTGGASPTGGAGGGSPTGGTSGTGG